MELASWIVRAIIIMMNSEIVKWGKQRLLCCIVLASPVMLLKLSS